MNDVPEIREKATYGERAIRLNEVRENYRSFKEQVIQDFKLQSGDGRLVFLLNISNFARSATVFLDFLQRCGDNKTFGQQSLHLTELTNLEANIKNQAKFVKLAWVTLFQFQIENLFKILLKEMEEEVPFSYWNVCKKILEVLNIEKPEETLFLLNVLAYFRNSLHSNGIHYGYKGMDSSGEINMVHFEFRHGQPIERIVTWDHVAHIWLNLLPLLENIYYHDKVKKIKKIVPNQFIPD